MNLGPLHDWLTGPFLDNPRWLWGVAGVVALLALLVQLLLRRLVVARLGALAAKTETLLDDVVVETIRRTSPLFMLAIGVLAGSFVLGQGERAELVRRLLVVASLFQGGIWGGAAVGFLLRSWQGKGRTDVAAISILSFLGRLGIWLLVGVLALDNLGVKVTTLLAGLGVGGIAVALAVQSILGDLFASVSILLDKPFEVGDFIVLGDILGTVEKVGVKTTRIRSLSGEEIVVSNGDLLGSRIRNYRRMTERRVAFKVGVAYDTPLAKLEAIPGWIRGIIDPKPTARFDRAHLLNLGAHSLEYEIVYYVNSRDYLPYADLQQAINLEILGILGREGVEIAFPTQTIHLRNVD